MFSFGFECVVRLKLLHFVIGPVIFPGWAVFALIQTVWEKDFPEKIYFLFLAMEIFHQKRKQGKKRQEENIINYRCAKVVELELHLEQVLAFYHVGLGSNWLNS